MSADFSGGPGFLAFVATFGLVIAAVILMLSLSRHLRKVRAQEAREAEEAAAEGGSTSAEEPVAEGSGDGEGGEGRGDEVAGEAGDRQ